MPRKVKRPNLESLVEYWQERLKLRDWKIVAEYQDLPPDTDGECTVDRELRQAVIKIDPKPSALVDREQTIEEVLVHEVLHVRFAGFDSRIPNKSGEWTELEAAINVLAEALLGLT